VKLIGLSGGIASGKSTIGARLAEQGAVRIDADQLARDAVLPGTPALRQIADHFGPQVLSADGTLDRAALAGLVFGDSARLATLNGIVHPAVRALAEQRIAAAAALHPDAIVVYEVPLLVEAAVKLPWDLIVIADAPAAVREDRLVTLRGMSRDEAQRRIASQASDAERRAIADVLIDTSGSEARTLEQVDELWSRLRLSGSTHTGLRD